MLDGIQQMGAEVLKG